MTGESGAGGVPPVMHLGRRTKIVATIGPATRSVDTMAELITAGADVLRLNFSHGTRDEHAENIEMARRASELAGRQVGVLGDLPGPKLRLDEVEGGVVELRKGSEVTLTTGEEVGAADHLPVSWDGLPSAVRQGEEIYLADGRVRLRALSTAPGTGALTFQASEAELALSWYRASRARAWSISCGFTSLSPT